LGFATTPWWPCFWDAVCDAARRWGSRWNPFSSERSTWSSPIWSTKGGHIRTVPMPAWVKTVIDAWTRAAGLTHARVFRAINKAGRVWGDGMTAKVRWDVVRYLGCKQKLRRAVNDTGSNPIP